MDIYIYSSAFQPVELLGGCTSIIWTQRWEELSEAQIVIPTSQIKEFSDYDDIVGLYLYNKGLNDYMIIDGYEVTYDSNQGELLTIYGLDLLSILQRRIVWEQTVVSGTLTSCVESLLNANIINPSNSNRAIGNFTIGTYSIGSHSVDSVQFTGTGVYDAIKKLCDTENVNYNVEINGSNLAFTLEESSDLRNVVIFSREFDNLLGYDKLYSTRQVKNVALVAGEGEGADRTTTAVNDTVGLERREIYVDARDLSSNNGEISEADYLKQLQARGTERLQELSIDNSFDATIDNGRMYVYQADYNLGDFVKVVDYRGKSYLAQITEYISSVDINGFSCYPNFEIKGEL